MRKFEEDLNKKFVLKKGLVQLAKHIERLFHEDLAKRHGISELTEWTQTSPRPIKTITPLLIVQESILRFSGLEDLLNKELNRLLKKLRISSDVNVAQLAILDVDTFEQMKPALMAGDFTLAESLNARTALDPDYKSMWDDFLSQHFPTYRQRDLETERRFGEILDRTKRSLFPGN